MDKTHQRIGAKSNAHVGSDFEDLAKNHFQKLRIDLERNYFLEVGFELKKSHKFDLGSNDPAVIVECKSHKWTVGGKTPSAKLTAWNEAMFYFYLAPRRYRKIMFVLLDRRKPGGETLLEYYRRTYSHLIPDEVEFFEYDESKEEVTNTYQGPTSHWK
jgi:hypothetical protein